MPCELVAAQRFGVAWPWPGRHANAVIRILSAVLRRAKTLGRNGLRGLLNEHDFVGCRDQLTPTGWGSSSA
jgi:hypothetical protein